MLGSHSGICDPARPSPSLGSDSPSIASAQPASASHPDQECTNWQGRSAVGEHVRSEVLPEHTAPVCLVRSIAAPCCVDSWQCGIYQALPRHRSATSAFMLVATAHWGAAPPRDRGSRAAATCCSRLSRSSDAARHCRMLRSSACPTLCPEPAHSCVMHLSRADHPCQMQLQDVNERYFNTFEV